MPVTLRITHADGTTELVRLPVEIWYYGPRYEFVRPFASDVTKVEIDPEGELPDVNLANNTWPRP